MKNKTSVVLLDSVSRVCDSAGLVDVEKLNDDTYAFRVELAANDTGKLPTDIRMFSSGVTHTTKGKFLFDEVSAKKVMQAYNELGHDRLPFDYGHGMVSYNGDQKAAAWFVPEVRNGELWATDIQWTPRAVAELTAREWRFYSPAFRALWPLDAVDEPALITRLINCALTNLPATIGQKPIVASQGDVEEKEGHNMKLVLTKLGVSEEAAAETRVNQLLSTETENSAALATATSRGFKSVAEMAAALDAQNKEADRMKKDARKAAIAQLSKEGRLPPPQHAFAESLSDEQFTAFTAGLPTESLTPGAGTPTALSTPPSGSGGDGPRTGNVSLTAEELEACRMFNQDPDEMKKVKQELLSGEHPFRYTPKQTKAVTL